jgi:zinc protease
MSTKSRARMTTTVAARTIVGSALLLFASLLSACASSGFSPQPPELRGEPKLWVPAFTTTRLPNGLTLHVNADPHLPMVAVAIGIRGGYLLDPPNKAGLSALMADSLITQSARIDRRTLANSYDAVGNRPTVATTPDGIILSMDVLEDRSAGALKIFSELLMRPAFDADDLERLRLEAAAEIEDSLSRPDSLALMGLRQLIYGDQHPLGLPSRGTRTSLTRITVTDLEERARQVLRPDQVVIVVAGAVDATLVAQTTSTLFGAWARPGTPSVRPPVVGPGLEPEGRKQVFFIAQPGATQTTIAVGRRGLPLTHPDHYLLRLVTGRAPAGASAWLRGKERVTYGVSALSEANTCSGHFGARLSVDAGATAMALDSIIGRYNARLDGYLDGEKVGLLAGEGLSFYSLKGRVISVAGQHVQGLPLDHFMQLRQRIDDQREGEVQIVSDKFIDGDAMQIVLVGDVNQLNAQVPGTNLGALTPLRLAAWR